MSVQEKPKALLIDLEGVLVSGKQYQLLAGAVETIDYCRTHSVPFKIVTNNTTETPDSLYRILTERGLVLEPNELQSPLTLLQKNLDKEKKYFVMGSKRLVEFVESYGVQVVAQPMADVVLCGGGKKMEELPLSLACEALVDHGAELLTLHRNKLYTDANNRRCMDIGAIVVALEYASGVTAMNLGKPSEEYFSAATSQWSYRASSILMVSDDPFSDLIGAQELGFQTAFVLTGKYDVDVVDTLPNKPNYILEDLFSLPRLLG